MFVNLRKDLIPGALSPRYGSILFLASRYEGFSLSLIEGMSQGLVPISYPVGVAPEVIKNGENGYLINSQEEAIACTRELLSNNETRLAMAAKAKETAQQFKSERIAQNLLDLYRHIKDEKRKSNQRQSGASDILELS
jgi:glycosyltransferase involved in cell wall biosynthesis